jgi:hypothetical protein
MASKIRTEADRKATPRVPPAPGTNANRGGAGQRISLERGSHTRSKKNPGKRPSKGG